MKKAPKKKLKKKEKSGVGNFVYYDYPVGSLVYYDHPVGVVRFIVFIYFFFFLIG